MQAEWLFWTVAATLSLGVAAAMVAPLIRGGARPERRASYDMQIYRDQLGEIDAEVARGVLTQDEAAGVRAEIGRRLLAAADEEAAEAAGGVAPRGASRVAAAAVALGLAFGAGALYATLGAPGRPDLPLAPRLERLAAERANRPSQAEVEAVAAKSPTEGASEAAPEDLALVERLRAALVERPEEVEGRRLLARSEAALGRWAAARAAQEQVIALVGPAATPEDLVDLAEFMILAAGGYVSPQAEAQLTRALDRAPDNPVARYYSGLALLQGGRADLTFRLWSRLLAEGPADAPWIPAIEAQIDEVAMLAGQAAPATPSRADVAAAEAMSEADRAAMISGMVAQLSDRLAAEGGPPEDWAQLIHSLGVLGRIDEAAAILREASDVFAADPAALALLRESARGAGVAE